MEARSKMIRDVRELAEAGKDAAEIAAIIGMSEHAVTNTMKLWHIKPRRPYFGPPAPPRHKLMGGR